jgi:subtilisin family serine protease
MLARNEAGVGPVVVTVIDSGVDDQVFPREFLFRSAVAGSRGSELGLGMHRNQTRPLDPTHWHGTIVADILAGGGAAGLRQQYQRLSRLMRLNIVNLYTPAPGDQGGFQIGESAVLAGVDWAIGQGMQVANISIGSETRIAGFLESLSKSQLILVVAAGNERRDLGEMALYPARYGGSDWRIITVAAHDGNHEVAEFSNYSGRYADIAAPGCAIPHTVKTNDDGPAYGTSYAAPLVSMTAAILRSFYVPPSSVKKRLQVGADFRPGLAQKIVLSGTLNIAKALSLYEDVVERGAQPPLFGEWIVEDSHSRFCDDGSIDATRIRKITPLGAAGQKVRLLYEDDGDNLLSAECQPAPEWKSGIKFRAAGETAAKPIAWSELTDYVKRFYDRDQRGGVGMSAAYVASR